MAEVHFVGELVGASGFSGASVFCKWFIEPGNSKWIVGRGDATGRTWIAEQNDPLSLAVWNHPIDIVYTTSSQSGWPKLYIEIYSSNSSELIDLVGYAWCHLPTAPGEHVRDIAVFRPAGSVYDQVASYFVGGNPRYENNSIVTSQDSRIGHDVVSMGVVQVRLEIIHKGFGSSVQFTNKNT